MIPYQRPPFSSTKSRYFYLENESGKLTDGNITLFILAENYLTYNIESFFAAPTIHYGKAIYDLGNIDKPGDYGVHAFQTAQGGLLGSYYSDLLLSKIEKSRVDANVNFTWSEHHIKAARWDGFVRPSGEYDDCCTFHVSGRNVRLWINRYVIIDEWDHSLEREVHFSGFYKLDLAIPTELMLEVRDINFESPIKLLWSANGLPREVIPDEALFWKVRLVGKDVFSPDSQHHDGDIK